MTAAKPPGEAFLDTLEKAITDTLKNRRATGKDKQQAIANGIKLAMIRNKILPEDQESFFGNK